MATAAAIRCLIGPLLDGWVGIYPQGAGQDERIGESIARSLKDDILQAVAQEADVMAYWFWRNRKFSATYWSNPGYFNSADRTAQEWMSGNPAAFGDLMSYRGEE